MKIKIIVPWKNLGCLGLKVGDGVENGFYIDCFVRPYIGIFLRYGATQYWVNIREHRITRRSLV